MYMSNQETRPQWLIWPGLYQKKSCGFYTIHSEGTAYITQTIRYFSYQVEGTANQSPPLLPRF